MNIVTSLLLLANTKVDANAVSVPKVDVTNALVQNIFNGILGIAGAVAIIFIVLGGLKYASSQGDPKSTAQGKEMIIYSLVGIVVITLSFALVQVVLGGTFK